MLIGIHITYARHTGGRVKKGDPITMGMYSCDHCRHEFEKRCSQMAGKRNHFCSRACTYAERGSTGLIGKTREATCVELYGVSNTFQSTETRVKSAETMLRRYGVTNTMDIPGARSKITQANLVRWALITDESLAEMQQKRRETCMKRYGVEHPMMLADVRQRATQSMLDQGFLRSKAERFLESMLVSLFGRDDVMTQVWQNDVAGRNHPVDLYVPSLRLMIEYDGYHHHRNDVKRRDEEFNVWCADKGRRLLRCTEAEMNTILGRTQARLPHRSKRLIELATDNALSMLRAVVVMASTMHAYVITVSDVLQMMTTPPTTASCVKFDP